MDSRDPPPCSLPDPASSSSSHSMGGRGPISGDIVVSHASDLGRLGGKHKRSDVDAAFSNVRPFSKRDAKNILRFLHDNQTVMDKWGGEEHAEMLRSRLENIVVPKTNEGVAMRAKTSSDMDRRIPTRVLISGTSAVYLWLAGSASHINADLSSAGDLPKSTAKTPKGTKSHIPQSAASPADKGCAEVLASLSEKDMCRFREIEPRPRIEHIFVAHYVASRMILAVPGDMSGPTQRATPIELESAQILVANIIKNDPLLRPTFLPAEIRLDAERGFFLYERFDSDGQAELRMLPLHHDPDSPITSAATYPGPDKMLFNHHLLVPSIPTRGRGPMHYGRLQLQDYQHRREVANHFELCEAACLVLTVLSPRVELQVIPDITRLMAVLMSDPSPDDRQRFLEAAHGEPGRFVAIARKCWGLTHEASPFVVARDETLVSDANAVGRMFAVSDVLGMGLTEHDGSAQEVVVPFAFPPALDGLDAKLQEHVFATGEAFFNLADCITYFENELECAGVAPASIAQLTDKDFGAALDGISGPTYEKSTGTVAEGAYDKRGEDLQTAREALSFVRAREVSRLALRETYGRVVEKLVYDRKIRDEQEAISRRWDIDPTTAPVGAGRKSKNKRKKAAVRETPNTGGADDERRPSVASRIRGVVEGFAQKMCKYRHYRKAINALNRFGMLEGFNLQSVHGSHRVLHGSDCASMTIVEPHGPKKEHSRSRFLKAFGGS